VASCACATSCYLYLKTAKTPKTNTKKITQQATVRKDEIFSLTKAVYEDLQTGISISEIATKGLTFNPPQVKAPNQAFFTGIPMWYKANQNVPPHIVMQLLMADSELTSWPDTSAQNANENASLSVPITKDSSKMITHLRTMFSVEFNPSYDDLLAHAYIKVAHALLPTFRGALCDTFGKNKVLIAPIKELRRCKAKLDELKAGGTPPPYAAGLGDFLRATVLCSSFVEMLDVLEKLRAKFQIIRVKARITPDSVGNKVFLVNLIVEDPRICPHSYAWSRWWDSQCVRMIGEVQIAVESMFYLDKLAHNMYEITRTRACSEWNHQQGYENVDSSLFPISPLHNVPLCLL